MSFVPNSPPKHWLLLLAGLMAFASYAEPARAAGLGVMPTTLRFPVDGARVQVLQLTNSGRETVAYELRVQEQSTAGAGRASQDLVATPSIVRLVPGEQVRVRIGLANRRTSDRELGYRIYLTQLPDPMRKPGAGVGVLLKIGVPVFVDVPGMQAKPLEWALRAVGGAAMLTVHNPGTTHARIDSATLVHGRQDTALTLPARYLMPFESMQLPLPAEVLGRTNLSVRAQTATGVQTVRVSAP